VLYETMNREDLNWRKLHEQVADKAILALNPCLTIIYHLY